MITVGLQALVIQFNGVLLKVFMSNSGWKQPDNDDDGGAHTLI